MRRLAAAVCVATLLPAAAAGHSFSDGLGPVGYLVEGALAVWVQPWLILPVAALGIGLGLAGRMRRALVLLGLGLVAGLVLSPLIVAQAIVAPPLAVGLVMAVVAALVPPARARGALPGLAVLTGVTVGADAIEGYHVIDMPPTLPVGVAPGGLLAVAALGGAAAASRAWLVRPWVTILWRIGASWVAAIQLLYLALLFAP